MLLLINVILVFLGDDHSPFSYEVLSTGNNDVATFYLNEEIKNASPCRWYNPRAKFPYNATEVKIITLWNWGIELTSSKNKLYFKV